MWELFGQFLANEHFAREMHISLEPVNDSAIAHVESDPALQDQFQEPVRRCWGPPTPWKLVLEQGLGPRGSATWGLP